MQAKKAQDICILNLQKIPHAIANHFIICSGNSHRQVEAIADAIVATSSQQVGEKPWKQEGLAAKEWILIDYVDVVVHVFHPEARTLYALEALWGDAIHTRIEE